jgi:predicted transposase/invertase (TIGR01784 family)
MKTDKIFHKLFAYHPELFFDLIGQLDWVEHYHPYQSEEVKETAFRLDGVLLPKDEEHPLILVEVQMKHEPDFYHRVFAELFVYLKQHEWMGTFKIVVLFKAKKNEPIRSKAFQHFFEQGFIDVYPLSSWLKQTKGQSLGLDVLRLVVTPPKQAISLARSLLEITNAENANILEQNLAEHISTIICYKFPTLTRLEIEAMLDLGFDVKKTAVYREVYEEGKEDGKAEGKAEGIDLGFARGLIELLTLQFGEVPEDIHAQILATNSTKLRAYYKSALQANSLEEIFRT